MRFAQRWVLGAVLAGLTGCRGDNPGLETDYAPLFSGTWYGQANYAFTGPGGARSSQQQVQQPVVVLGKNHLRLSNFCSESDPGPEADVTSATQFQIRAYTCSLPIQPCPATLSLSGGSGTLSGQGLLLSLQGSIAVTAGGGCQADTTQFSISFSGSHTPPQSAMPPDAPQDLAATRGDAYGVFLLTWGSSGTTFLGQVQVRIGNGTYQDVTGYLSGAGVTVQLDPTGLPERTAVSFRIRVANSVGTSDFSNEASSSSALLAPTLQGAQQVSTGVRLTWVPRSDVTALLVERSDLQNPSAYAVIGSANPGQTAFVDTTLVEGGYYYYRLHWVDGALQGYPSYSNPIPTSLLAPSDLVAVGGVERVDLSWVNHSQTATEVDVFRADGLNDFYFGQLVAQLPPTATSHSDPVPTGIYTYRVEAHSSAVGSSGGPVAFAATVPPASARSWSIEFADQPVASRAVLDSTGRYLFWGQDLTLRRSDGAPEVVRGPSSSLPIPFPYFLLDASGHPHLIYLRQTVQGGTTMAVLHEWFNGNAWSSEELARLTAQSYAFALDSTGRPVVAVSADATGEGLRVIRWSGTNYVVENPNLTFTQGSSSISNYLLATSSSGQIHLVVETFLAETVHASRDGTWSQEAVALSSPNAAIGLLAAFGTDRLALVFNDFGRIQVLEKGSVGWTAPLPIASGGSLSSPFDAVLDEGAEGGSPAVLLGTSGGLQLARASEGWAPSVLTSRWPIIGFGHDTAGKLYVVASAGQNFTFTPAVAHAVIFREQ